MAGRAATGAAVAFNAYVSIDSSGDIALTAPLADMGQGVYSSLPKLIAEELDVAWEDVVVRLAPTSQEYDNPLARDQYSANSQSIRGYYQPLRRLGAATRQMLVQAAASRWSVPVESCSTRAGVVRHLPSGRTAPYAELAEAAAKLEPPAEVTLKNPAEFRLIGESAPRRDVPAKVAGEETFGIDVRRPGMRYAAIRHVPAFGGKLVSFSRPDDLGDVEAIFTLGERALVAVAGDTWAAQHAVESCPWQLAPAANPVPDAELYARDLREALDQPGRLQGRPKDAPSLHSTTDWDLVSDYSVPFLAHAALEPPACTAEWRDERLRIWAPVQGPARARTAVASALDLSEDHVDVQQVSMGGSFGRKSDVDFVVEAAEIAKRVGGAIRLTWSREEDIQHDFYRPAYAARLKAQIDDKGYPTRIAAKTAGPSLLADRYPDVAKNVVDPSAIKNLIGSAYTVPEIQRRFVRVPTNVPTGFWRSVSSSMNGFFSETFINEMAHACESDPIEYRESLARDDTRAQRVLAEVRRLANWDQASADVHRGVALCTPYESYLAQMVELRMLDEKAFTIERICTVVDCGVAVEPTNVQAQIEGGTLFGLTAALFGEISFSDGKVEQSNYHDYPMLTLAQTPTMTTKVLMSTEDPGGVGELGVPAVAPALVAALHSATGKWVRRLPIERSGFRLE